MAATMAKMVKAVVLLLFVMQIFCGFASAARPLQEGHGGWMENGIEMVTRMLGSVKQSGSNGHGHCC
ncbi:hypothetical protein BRADI_5g06523v3 [Brachypodium distachyon]|uniref:Uncharacterized protein n=1 Tax=Brachypodium distachyon TaxID=15368 RepID=A0A0Q3KQB0_BRADI|nr:hypothetical protein BRADI_5g06523v3 [Brachypodium distachyon]